MWSRKQQMVKLYPADLCERSSLYQATYWNSPRDDNAATRRELQEIIHTRDMVAQDFSLKRNVKHTAPAYVYDVEAYAKEYREWHDHVEVYSCPGGFMVFMSPYLSMDDPVPEGWVAIEQIYDMQCPTICRFIPGRGMAARRERHAVWNEN
jgi:hypothetical protein